MRKFLVFFSLASALAGPLTAATLLKAGDALPALSLTDQHDKPVQIEGAVRRVYFAADNSGGQLATAFIDRRGAAWLKESGSVYLADIHRMPRLIASMFALPQLREKSYPIALGRDEADLAMFPRRKDCVTVIAVRQGVLSEPLFACSDDELEKGNGP